MKIGFLLRGVNKKIMGVIAFGLLMFAMSSNVFAEVVYTEVSSSTELKEAIANDENVKLVASFELSESIKMVEQKITLDLNGHVITGYDNNEKGNYSLFEVFKGEFTVVDSVGTGKITLVAATDRDWNAMSNIIEDHTSVVEITGGEFIHLGGTDMAYVVNVNANSYGATTLNVKGGKLRSTYTAVRLFMDKSGTSYLNISGGELDGTTSAIWAQAPSSKPDIQRGQIRISAGKVGVINTARGTNAEVDTIISGGVVKSVKVEEGELKVTGGVVEGEFIILDANGEAVNNDEIITAGTFLVDPSNYVASSVTNTAKITSGEEVVYVVGKDLVVDAILGAERHSIIELYGDITLVDVPNSLTLKAIGDSKITANGMEVTKEGITLEAKFDVSNEELKLEEKVEEVKVGVSNNEEVKDVLSDSLNELLESSTDKELVDKIYDNDTKVEIEIENIDKIVDKEVTKSIEEKFKDVTVATYFDITVAVKSLDNDEVYGTLDKLTKEIELMALLPNELKNTNKAMVRNYYVIRRHINEDGSVSIEKLPTTLSKDGNSLLFKTDRFSTYALAYNDVKNPKTGDGIMSSFIVSLVSLMVLIGGSVIYLKKKARA